MKINELRDRVDKIKIRVLISKKKPILSDIHTLLAYIEEQEKLIQDLTSGAERLTDSANELVDLLGETPGISVKMFNINSPSSIEQIMNSSGEMDEWLRDFIINNKDAIIEEAEVAREKLVDEFGEDSNEVMIVDDLIRKIEEL